MEAWIKAVKPFGDVLEIGGKRLSAHSKEIRSWQEELPSLGMFDTILYHGKPEVEASQADQGSLLVQEGNEALRKIHETLPGLKTIRYSDHDLETFCKQIKPSQKAFLARFLSNLHANGQITEAQYQKYQSEPHRRAGLFECIQECLKHLRVGGRFSCRIDTSKYEDPKFFEHFIANPCLEYQETASFLIIEKKC